MNEDRKIAVSWKAPGMVVQLPCGCGHPLAYSPPCTDPVGDAAHRSLADEASRNWIWTRHLMLRACLWAAQGNDKAFSSTTDEVRAMLEAQGLLPGGTVTLCAHEGTDPLHTLSRIEPEYRQALWQFTYVHVLATNRSAAPNWLTHHLLQAIVCSNNAARAAGCSWGEQQGTGGRVHCVEVIHHHSARQASPF